jgi:hypothetical protein
VWITCLRIGEEVEQGWGTTQVVSHLFVRHLQQVLAVARSHNAPDFLVPNSLNLRVDVNRAAGRKAGVPLFPLLLTVLIDGRIASQDKRSNVRISMVPNEIQCNQVVLPRNVAESAPELLQEYREGHRWAQHEDMADCGNVYAFRKNVHGADDL